MNKNDLIASVASSAGLSKSDATRSIESFLDAVNDDKIMLIIKNRYKWPKDISKEIIDLLEDYIKSEGFRK